MLGPGWKMLPCTVGTTATSSHHTADLAVAEKTCGNRCFFNQKTKDIKNQSNKTICQLVTIRVPKEQNGSFLKLIDPC